MKKRLKSKKGVDTGQDNITNQNTWIEKPHKPVETEKSGETQEIAMNISENSDQHGVIFIEKPDEPVEKEKSVETQETRVGSDQHGVVNEEQNVVNNEHKRE